MLTNQLYSVCVCVCVSKLVCVCVCVRLAMFYIHALCVYICVVHAQHESRQGYAANAAHPCEIDY